MSTIWAFDLGKGSIGEAVWNPGKKQFDHVASLLIPAEFASTKEAASRRRMMRTRQAHKAREAWLDEVWKAADLTPLVGRRVGKVDAQGNWIEPKEWKKKKGTWKLQHEGDPRLEREFPAKGDSTCYTSCLLRIKLLHGEKLEEWQIYKALHSAVQKRGYERVPWAAKEAARKGLSIEEMEKREEQQLATKDPAYQRAVKGWKLFKDEVAPEDCCYPCYYDAWCMGLWKTENVKQPPSNSKQVRFARDAIDGEIILLAEKACEQLSKLEAGFQQIKSQGVLMEDWIERKKQEGREPYEGKRVRRLKVIADSFAEFLCHGPSGKPYGGYSEEEWLEGEKWEIEILEHPDPSKKGKKAAVRPGSDVDWKAATGQKIPRFDNRIIASCALMPELGVCRLAPHYVKDSDKRKWLDSRSLLAAEVTFLLQAKNQQVSDLNGVRYLNADEMCDLLALARQKAMEVSLEEAGWEGRVLACYKVTRPAWRSWCAKRELEPVGMKEAADTKSAEPATGDATQATTDNSDSSEVIKPSRPSGRARFCRPALAVLMHLLKGKCNPNELHQRLKAKEESLMVELGFRITTDRNKPKDGATKILESDLEFLPFMWRDTDDTGDKRDYEPYQLRIPDMALRHLKKAHGITDEPYHELARKTQLKDDVGIKESAQKQIAARSKAILELIREQRNPIVRERLHRYWQELVMQGPPILLPSDEALQKKALEEGKKYRPKTGYKNQHDPECIVLEFVRDGKDNSMEGQKRVKAYEDAMKEREKARDIARASLPTGVPATNDIIVRRMLFTDQGASCLYEGTALGCSDFMSLEIEHIVPRSMGGPDAYWNWVLTTSDANAEKAERVPFKWFRDERSPEEWRCYKERVLQHAKTLGRRKVDLLLRADAAELVGSKYTALADTAWVSRLAQSVARLHFGWPLDDEREKERVITLSGGLTARIRRKYLLDTLLGQDKESIVRRAEVDEILAKLDEVYSRPKSEENKKEARELREKLQAVSGLTDKQRDDKRHHALDAMVLSMLAGWVRVRDRRYEDFFRFPDFVGDTPVYSQEGREQKEAIERDLAVLRKETKPQRDAIKAAKDLKEKERLRQEILPQRRRMALLLKSIDKLKQPRNVRKVREWFRERLAKINDSEQAPPVMPRYVARQKAEPKAGRFRKVYLVRKQNERSGLVPLAEFPFFPDARHSEGKNVDVKWLFAQVQSVTSHASYDLSKLKGIGVRGRELGCLVAASRKWSERERAKSLQAEKEQWLECLRTEHVAECFKAVGRGKSKKTPEVADLMVKVCRIDVVPARRYALMELAYAKGETYVWNPEHLRIMASKVLRKLETVKKGRGKTIKAMAMHGASDSEQPYPGFALNKQVESLLTSPETMKEIEELSKKLPGVKSRDFDDEEKAAWEEDEEAFKKAIDAFAKKHKLGGRLFILEDGKAPGKMPNKGLRQVLFEAQKSIFDLSTLEKALKSIADSETVGLLALLIQSLRKHYDKKPLEQEKHWKLLSGSMKLIRKQERQAFLAQYPDPTPEQWAAQMTTSQSSRLVMVTQTVGMLGKDAGIVLGDYADMSKDGAGSYADGGNHGYIIAKQNGDATSHAVRFFESVAQVKERLKTNGWEIHDEKPWMNGDLMSLDALTGRGERSIPPGHYFFGSISNGRSVTLNGCFGEKLPTNISLKELVKNNLRRV